MGSYIVIKVLNKSVSLGVGVAVFGAFIGGLFALIYIKYKIYKNKDKFNKEKIKEKDNITNKEIIKKIITYSIPLIIVSIATDIYGLTDMTLMIRTLYTLGYDGKASETIASIVATWAPKICMIINSVAIGLSTSLIPHMVASFTKNDLKESNNKFNEAINIIIFTTFPLVIGLSLLSRPTYTLFYGQSMYGSEILKYTSFVAFFASIYIVMSMALQSLNKFKTVYLSTILGFLTNALLDIPLMYLFKKSGLDAYYGAILATIIGYILSFTIVLISLKKSLNFKYKNILKTILKTLIPSLSMLLVLLIMSKFININVTGTLNIIIVCLTYAIVGGIIYIFTSYKIGLLNEVLGSDFINKILNKLNLKH